MREFRIALAKRFQFEFTSGDYNEFASVSRHAKSILLQWQSGYIMTSCTEKDISKKG